MYLYTVYNKLKNDWYNTIMYFQSPEAAVTGVNEWLMDSSIKSCKYIWHSVWLHISENPEGVS